jgi:carboxyl-terminal processing protease
MAKTDDYNKKRMRYQRLLVVSLIFVSFLFGWAFGHLDFQRNMFGYIPGQTDKSKRPNFELFWSAWDKVTSQYDGPIDSQKLLYGAITGMVNALGDPYTAFFTKSESEKFNDELEGTISGIGAEVGMKGERPIIISPITDSPAKKAGIRAQDIILKIDDTDTKNMDINTAVSKIRGQAGTTVKLTIQRGDKTLEFSIKRENIEVKSVSYEIKEGNIGYVQISRFDSNTSSLLKAANKDLRSKNVKGIVLDLRNNPGGYLDAAVDVASEYIEKGTVVIEKKNDSNKKEEYKSTGKGTYTDASIPMVVLVNGGSASASEIVAGALQDYKRAILLGEKTFGKGSVQAVENLGGGNTLHITIAHWYTPKNRSINKEGLNPDNKVELSDEDYQNNRDPQLDKAIEYLKSKIK